ncbi:MAG: hypothetical protein D6784_16395 [Chloroflexi bacterium]|nr:MAG: hypothetical protein D6784_16395 [Chloroflexota bacterium]
MLYLISAVLIVVATVLLIVRFVLWWADYIAHRHITSHFQEAEFILSYHRPPPRWLTSIPKDRPLKPQLISRLDNLIAFFTVSPFFDAEETRHLLLSQLRQEKQHWTAQTDKKLLGSETELLIDN